MPNSEIKTYEDLKNNESVQSDINLKKLINEIDEIKDTTSNDDDKIEGIFSESNDGKIAEKTLNQGFVESLNKQNNEVIQILIIEINKIHNDTNLQLDDNTKNSLKILGELLSGIKKSNKESTNKTAENELSTIKTEILGTNSDKFYEGYNYSEQEIESHHYYTKGRIIENIQQYVQGITEENRDISEFEIISNIRPNLVTLPTEERANILKGIEIIVKKFNNIRKYLDFENGPYKSPKQLLFAMHGITKPEDIEPYTDNITVKQNGLSLTFFIGDKKDYDYFAGRSNTSGFSSKSSHIEELKGTLCCINGEESKENKILYCTSDNTIETHISCQKSIKTQQSLMQKTKFSHT